MRFRRARRTPVQWQAGRIGKLAEPVSMRALANAYYGYAYVMVTVIWNSMLSEWVIIGS